MIQSPSAFQSAADRCADKIVAEQFAHLTDEQHYLIRNAIAIGWMAGVLFERDEARQDPDDPRRERYDDPTLSAEERQT